MRADFLRERYGKRVYWQSCYYSSQVQALDTGPWFLRLYHNACWIHHKDMTGDTGDKVCGAQKLYGV
jgi:hypothetical protein